MSSALHFQITLCCKRIQNGLQLFLCKFEAYSRIGGERRIILVDQPVRMCDTGCNTDQVRERLEDIGTLHRRDTTKLVTKYDHKNQYLQQKPFLAGSECRTCRLE